MLLCINNRAWVCVRAKMCELVYVCICMKKIYIYIYGAELSWFALSAALNVGKYVHTLSFRLALCIQQQQGLKLSAQHHWQVPMIQLMT